MAEKSSGSGSGFSLNVNTLLALLTLGGSAWFVSQTLTSDRPVAQAGGPRSFVGEQTLEARLWEDPFKAEDRDGQRRRTLIETNFDILQEQIQERTNSRVLVLPVMVSGGQYSEDQESRIRSRYAIVSALSRSGFAPEDAEHLGAVTLPWPTQLELAHAIRATRTNPLETLWQPCEVPGTNQSRKTVQYPLGLDTRFFMDVHYEWYRHRTFFPRSTNGVPHPHHVLVLWLDDSFFEDEPLLRLPLLLGRLGLNEDRTRVSIIGPRRSSTLRAMLPGELAGTVPLQNANGNLWRLAKNVLGQIELYCATPSAMDAVLVANATDRSRSAVSEALTKTGFKAFHNYAATDAQLAKEMLDELALRSADMKSKANHLVLISEWDTFYARMLALTYGTEIAMRQATGTVTRDRIIQDYIYNGTNLPANFHSLVYLRGLDGQTIGANSSAKTTKEGSGKSPTASFEELRKWVPDANKAEGQAQFDYLGRLGGQLDELEERLRHEYKRARIAVGIVGSDVYDTLLILQALRERFPHFLFFTTDLDARFWHPRERGWSRNLIITSAYGLALHEELQGDVAPFRDSMQTAQFTAALAALGNTNLAHLTCIPPRRFEIGNHGAVDLSVVPGCIIAPSVACDTTNGPWLHPLTDQQTYQANAIDVSWSNAFGLFPWPFKSEDKPRTGDVFTILSLYGLGFLLLLGCVFWRPLRARTIGIVGFTREVLRYRYCDVGGPEGEAILTERLRKESNNGDRFRSILAKAWAAYSEPRSVLAAKDYEAVPRERWVTTGGQNLSSEQSSGATTGLATVVEVEPEPQKVEEQSQLQPACDFVAFLNGRLGENQDLPVCLPWKPRWLLRRWDNRFWFDNVLDSLAPHSADPSQVSAARSARMAARRLFWLRFWNVIGFWIAAATVIGLAWSLGWDIWRDASERPQSEPFSLVNGISGWPAIILRIMAVVLSVFFCSALYSQMRVMYYELTRRYRLPLAGEVSRQNANHPTAAARNPALLIYRWVRDHCFPFQNDGSSKSGRVSAADLWRHYRQGQHPVARLLRVLIPFLSYFLLATVIYQLFGSPSQPLRGDKANDAIFQWSRFGMPEDSVIKGQAIVNLAFFLLTFLTIDAARHCCRFIEKLSAGAEFPEATRTHYRSKRGNVPSDCLDDWIGTRLIADLTERVGKLLWFPGIVFLLLLIARLPWWDNWPWHPAHVIIMTLNFIIALASVVILQRAARAAKQAAEERLTAKVKKLQAIASSPKQNDATQAEGLLKEVREIHHGAFAPIWENPVVGAVLVGPGGLTMLQMLVWFVGR